jgi:hypothetical protein
LPDLIILPANVRFGLSERRAVSTDTEHSQHFWSIPEHLRSQSLATRNDLVLR